MAEYIIDSWGPEQLFRLKDFFENKAKPGDQVIFDESLARRNAPAHEGLDDNGCNSFVFHSANQALQGLDEARMKMLVDAITLSTRKIHDEIQSHDLDQHDAEPEGDLWADDLELDLNLDLMTLNKSNRKPMVPEISDDPEADSWAAEKAKMLEMYGIG